MTVFDVFFACKHASIFMEVQHGPEGGKTKEWAGKKIGRTALDGWRRLFAVIYEGLDLCC